MEYRIGSCPFAVPTIRNKLNASSDDLSGRAPNSVQRTSRQSKTGYASHANAMSLTMPGRSDDNAGIKIQKYQG
jgi:hypothetical protein